MNNILKDKLLKNNISLNETEVIILFLLSDKNDLTAEEMLKIGHFSTSNLLFNLNTLNSNSYIESSNYKEDNPLKMSSNLSLNGINILSNVHKICKNIMTNSDKNYLNLLLEYENTIKHLVPKNRQF